MFKCPLAAGNVSLADQRQIEEWWNTTNTIIFTFQDGAYQVASFVLMAMGVLGHGASLVTLFLGESLQTAHFYFYRTMALAEFLYCLNFFVTDALVRIHTKCETYSCLITDWFASFYSWKMSRFVYSSSGYVVLYMSLFICMDRAAAIWFGAKYHRVSNHRKTFVTKLLVYLAVGSATIVHSWDAFFQIIILEHRFSTWNDTAGYSPVSRRNPAWYNTLKQVKDIYNLTTRSIYPIALLILTVAVIVGLVRFEQHRQSIVSSTTQRAIQQRFVERRRERHLFYLMGAVVSLAFVQVVPTEVKRILQRIGQNERIGICASHAMHWLLSADDTWYVFKFLLAERVVAITANVTTMMDRSLKFYMYFFLNRQIRHEALNVFCRCCGRCRCQNVAANHWTERIIGCIDTVHRRMRRTGLRRNGSLRPSVELPLTQSNAASPLLSVSAVRPVTVM